MNVSIFFRTSGFYYMPSNLYMNVRSGYFYPTLAVVILSLSACEFMSEHQGTDEVTVHNAWVRTTPPGATTSALYLTVNNPTDKTITLISISSSITDKIEIHHTVAEEGMMKMRSLDEVDVPSNSSVKLVPNGIHGMLFNLAQPLIEGNEVNVELAFASHPSITFVAMIQKGPPQDMKH